MRKTNEEKLRALLEGQELMAQWYNHLQKSQPTTTILDRAYSIREFVKFIGKPFQEAVKDDMGAYIQHKASTVGVESAKTYRYRVQGFYRWMLKHTDIAIERELAYPQPKVVKKKEIAREDVFKRRVEAVLTNTIICSNKREDQLLTQDGLKKKYPHKLLKEHNLKVLNSFYNYKTTSGEVTSEIGFVSKLQFLKRFGLFLDDKSYKEATREDIQDFLQVIKKSNGKINSSYKAHLLDFYRFVYGMFGNEKPRKYPDVVSWLYNKRKKINERLAKEIIPDKEIKAMLNACTEQRDRALISVLRDSSARVGELTNLCIRDVITAVISSNGGHEHQIATIRLRGKTGERTNQLFWSVSDLRLLLMCHPLKDNPDAPLFIATSGGRYGQRLTSVGVNKILQRVANRAGIKRHIHAHLFRHTNLTKMAQVLSESELKIHAGWGANSNMAEVYIHLTADDVSRKLLKQWGVHVEEEEFEEDVLSIKVCPNNVCGYQNPGEAKFCLKCGYPLSLKTAVELRKLKDKEEGLHKAILSKGTSGVEMKGNDLREIMYQIVKGDECLLERLREIAVMAEGLGDGQ